MALKTFSFFLLFAGLGFFHTQAASLVSNTWSTLDEDAAGSERSMEIENNMGTDEPFTSDLDFSEKAVRDDIAYDLAADAASDINYYKNYIEARAVPSCGDAFPHLCRKLGKGSMCHNRRHMRFAQKFCLRSCSDYC